jgi:hypothetical protein
MSRNVFTVKLHWFINSVRLSKPYLISISTTLVRYACGLLEPLVAIWTTLLLKLECLAFYHYKL